MRTTKSEVEAVFKNWVKAVDGHIAVDYKDVGGYRLDHNSIYGGYEIERICNAQGGVSVVMYQRLSAYYFVQALRLAIHSIEQQRLNSKTEVA